MTREEIAAELMDWVDDTYGGVPCDEDDAFRFVDRLIDHGLVLS